MVPAGRREDLKHLAAKGSGGISLPLLYPMSLWEVRVS